MPFWGSPGNPHSAPGKRGGKRDLWSGGKKPVGFSHRRVKCILRGSSAEKEETGFLSYFLFFLRLFIFSLADFKKKSSRLQKRGDILGCPQPARRRCFSVTTPFLSSPFSFFSRGQKPLTRPSCFFSESPMHTHDVDLRALLHSLPRPRGTTKTDPPQSKSRTTHFSI